MQQSLETDPLYAERFARIGEAAVELDVEGSTAANRCWATSRWMSCGQRRARAHALFTTASSFRASIPPGPIRMEDYLTALPTRTAC